MSYFGDGTPQQEMLDWAEHVKGEFDLTTRDLVVVLLQVTNAIADPLGTRGDEMRQNEMPPG